MKSGDFSLNLSGINILDYFFKISTGFGVMAVPALFHDQVLSLCMSSVTIVNISFAVLVVFESTGFRKNLYKTYIKLIFPIDTVIMDLGNYIWGI